MEIKGANGSKVHFQHIKENPRESVLGRSEYASESGPGGPPSDHRERVRCGELKKGTGSAPAAGTRKGKSENLPFLVPRAGVEPARVAPLVFETSASTDSAIWAWYQNRREGTTI